MTNNTIHNVPRDLLERLCIASDECRDNPLALFALTEELRGLLSAPPPAGVYSADPLACPGCASGCFRCASPAGVDGLEVVGWYRMDDRKAITPYPSVCATWHKMGVKVGAAYSDSAQAIIDGLRGEVAAIKEQSETRWAAYVRESNIRREIEQQLDRQAQRIGELEGLLREIGDRCEQRDMPGEQTIAEWSDQIDVALYSR